MGIVWNTLKRLFLPFNITKYIQVHILGHKKAMYTVKIYFHRDSELLTAN